MTTAVHVNTSTYAATHVATNMLGSIRSIIKGSGLNPDLLRDQWATLETRHRDLAGVPAPEDGHPGGLRPRQAAQRLRRPVRLHHRLRLLPRRRRGPVARPGHRCLHHPEERLVPRPLPVPDRHRQRSRLPADPRLDGHHLPVHRGIHPPHRRHRARRRQPRRRPVLLHTGAADDHGRATRSGSSAATWRPPTPRTPPPAAGSGSSAASWTRPSTSSPTSSPAPTGGTPRPSRCATSTS